jgi:hypothetical protein
MVGTVSQEGWPFIFAGSPKPLSEAEYILFTAYLFGIDMVSVLRMYPVGGIWDYSDYRPLLAELSTDFIFVCLTRGVARKISSLGTLVAILVCAFCNFFLLGRQEFLRTCTNSITPPPSIFGATSSSSVLVVVRFSNNSPNYISICDIPFL